MSHINAPCSTHCRRCVSLPQCRRYQKLSFTRWRPQNSPSMYSAFPLPPLPPAIARSQVGALQSGGPRVVQAPLRLHMYLPIHVERLSIRNYVHRIEDDHRLGNRRYPPPLIRTSDCTYYRHKTCDRYGHAAKPAKRQLGATKRVARENFMHRNARRCTQLLLRSEWMLLQCTLHVSSVSATRQQPICKDIPIYSLSLFNFKISFFAFDNVSMLYVSTTT